MNKFLNIFIYSKLNSLFIFILQEEFVTRVLVGTDIFKTTDPQEWARFKEFIEEEGPFTTVIDGLNVTYTGAQKAPHVRMKRVRICKSEILRNFVFECTALKLL